MGCDEAGVYGDVGLRFRPFLSSLVREVMILAKYLGASNDLIMICNFEFFFGCCWCYIWLMLKNGVFDFENREVKMTVDAIL